MSTRGLSATLGVPVRHLVPLLPAALLLLPVRSPAQDPRRVVAAVELDVGGPNDDPARELLRVGDALRLGDGRLLVAGSRPLSVDLYDARGRWVRSLGRSGGGPGEYQYGALLRPWRGDSVLVYSQGTRRWLLYGLDGTVVREWPVADGASAPTAQMVLRGNAILRSEMVGSRGCPAEALAREAPRSGEALQEALVDPSGRLWLRSVVDDEDWRVLDRSGATVAVLALPEGFRVLGFDDDRVVGVQEDGDGFPHVLILRTGLPPAPRAPAGSCDASELPVSLVRAAEFKTALRNAMTVAEAYYADHRTYPGRSADFPRAMLPDRADFEVLGSGERGYVFLVRDRATGFRCLVQVGAGGMGRLPDGVLLCGG